jgi:hypothetical protein
MGDRGEGCGREDVGYDTPVRMSFLHNTKET